MSIFFLLFNIFLSKNCFNIIISITYLLDKKKSIIINYNTNLEFQLNIPNYLTQYTNNIPI